MPKFSVTRHVSFAPEQVFAVVADVKSYAHFVPLVKKSLVSNERALAGGGSEFDAALTISYRKLGIAEVLTSHVTVDPARRSVVARSSEGMLTHLEAEWLVEPAKSGADVHFNVDYTLKSKTLQVLMSGMFDLMVRKVMAAFVDRTRELYGSTGLPAA